jgi:hypothetical protein
MFLCLATTLIVAAADYFFWDTRVGWTAAALVAATFAFIALRDTRFFRSIIGKVFALALLGLLVALIEQPFYLNIAYALLCLSGVALVNAMGPENDFTRWLKRWTRWVSFGWLRFFIDNSAVVRFLMRRGISPGRARGIAAWIVPTLLSCIFIAIFAWANPIISNWLSHVSTWLSNLAEHLPDLVNPSRVFFWLTFAIVAWMLFRGRVRRPRVVIELELAEGEMITPPLHVPAGFVVRCLLLFNIVFAVENVVDLRYLFAESLPEGISYTEYVHRGAYPLIAAALLAGAFVLITFRPDSATEKSSAARRLVYLWITQTILLTLSAAYRLSVYISLFSMTRLRLASIIWFSLVATGLFYLVWRIIRGRSNAWLINVNAVTALLVLYVCCFINFDGFIADFNANHCAEAGGSGNVFDAEYSLTLGPAALPALERIRPKLTDPNRAARAAEVSRELYAELKEDLSDWRSWTWRRQRAQHAADAIAATNSASQGALASTVQR